MMDSSLSRLVFVASSTLLFLSLPFWSLIFQRKKKKPGEGGICKVGKELREEEFDHLDKTCAFCNSGSWSCVPRTLIQRQAHLIREREVNNQIWSAETEPNLIWESLEMLADFVGAKVENITLTDNSTAGTNAILKSQTYTTGDKILLCNNHTYGAVITQAKFIVQDNPGVEIAMVEISYPINGKDDVISAFRKALEEHSGIKIAVIDHISSATAILFPVKEIVELCHQHDVITVIDGAHAPGQLKLTVEDYGTDYYVGNLCKWMMIPQNVGFLWVHPQHHHIIQPVMTSHTAFDPIFRNRFYPAMTKDRTCHILVKDAIKFYKELGDFEAITARHRKMVKDASKMISEAWSASQLQVNEEVRAPNMAVIGLPEKLKRSYVNHTEEDLTYDLLMNGVALRVCTIEGEKWCRLSCHVWNDWEDFEQVRDRVAKMAEDSKRYPGETSRPPYYVPYPAEDKLN